MRESEPEFTFNDDRGVIAQLTSSPAQINYAATFKGKSRGGHYHKTATETFFLIKGSLWLYLTNISTDEQTTLMFRAGEIFTVHPYEKHTILAIEDCEWVAWFDKVIGKGDTYKE